VRVTQVAGESELYWGRFTLHGVAGVEFGNSVSGPDTTNTFIEVFDSKTRFFDQVTLKYYFIDNWNGYIGHRYLGGNHALAVGTEAALALSGGVMASAFLEAYAGEDQFHGVWGGLRYYFGQKDKSLIRRHREDDPPIGHFPVHPSRFICVGACR